MNLPKVGSEIVDGGYRYLVDAHVTRNGKLLARLEPVMEDGELAQPKDLRVVTNSEAFRVQVRRFGFWWILKGWPYNGRGIALGELPIEFNTHEAALRHLRQYANDRQERRRLAKRGWKPVEKLANE